LHPIEQGRPHLQHRGLELNWITELPEDWSWPFLLLIIQSHRGATLMWKKNKVKGAGKSLSLTTHTQPHTPHNWSFRLASLLALCECVGVTSNSTPKGGFGIVEFHFFARQPNLLSFPQHTQPSSFLEVPPHCKWFFPTSHS